jgi:hypothetical protein
MAMVAGVIAILPYVGILAGPMAVVLSIASDGRYKGAGDTPATFVRSARILGIVGFVESLLFFVAFALWMLMIYKTGG